MKRITATFVVIFVIVLSGVMDADHAQQSGLHLVVNMKPDDDSTRHLMSRLGVNEATLADAFASRLRARGVPIEGVYTMASVPSNLPTPMIEVLFQPIQTRNIATGIPVGHVAFSLTMSAWIDVSGDHIDQPFHATPLVLTGIGSADLTVANQILSQNIDMLADEFSRWYFG